MGAGLTKSILHWDRKWEVCKKLTSGGQGNSFVVKKKGMRTETFFLKELPKIKNSSERRQRLYREISCYRTLNHLQIPKLIDSNEQVFIKDVQVVPYVVSEYIGGNNLTEFCKGKTFTSFEAINLTCSLLEVVRYIWQQDTIHRDIKPDNIIIRGDNHLDPVLVDFGMAVCEEDAQLSKGQEIGNRFLRLPEFSISGSEKRSHASDITFCVGILFFLLTDEMPRQLRDEDDKAPHQRKSARSGLGKHKDEIDIIKLKNIFDRGFDQAIQNRWQSTEEIIFHLRELQGGRCMKSKKTNKENREIIKEFMNSHEEEKNNDAHEIIEKYYKILCDIVKRVALSFENSGIISGNNRFTEVSKKQGTLGITNRTGSVSYQPNYSIELCGCEIIIKINNEQIFRESVDEENIDELEVKFEENILSGLLSQIESKA